MSDGLMGSAQGVLRGCGKQTLLMIFNLGTCISWDGHIKGEATLLVIVSWGRASNQSCSRDEKRSFTALTLPWSIILGQALVSRMRMCSILCQQFFLQTNALCAPTCMLQHACPFTHQRTCKCTSCRWLLGLWCGDWGATLLQAQVGCDRPLVWHCNGDNGDRYGNMCGHVRVFVPINVFQRAQICRGRYTMAMNQLWTWFLPYSI